MKITETGALRHNYTLEMCDFPEVVNVRALVPGIETNAGRIAYSGKVRLINGEHAFVSFYPLQGRVFVSHENSFSGHRLDELMEKICLYDENWNCIE